MATPGMLFRVSSGVTHSYFGETCYRGSCYKVNAGYPGSVVWVFWSQGKAYTSFELQMEKAELTFALLAQPFEDQWKVTAGKSGLSLILPKPSAALFWLVPNNFCRNLNKRNQSDKLLVQGVLKVYVRIMIFQY